MDNDDISTFSKIMKYISKHRFRSLLLITGNEIKKVLQNIHYLWVKSSSQKRSSLLWCFKNKTRKSEIFSTKKDKTIKHEDFLKKLDITYCYYDQTRKILGNTYGICILEDFEAISPNILARVIETIEGGGIIIFMIETVNSIENLRKVSLNVHKNWNSHVFSTITSRFIKNFIFSLSDCATFLHLNEDITNFSKNLKLIYSGKIEKIHLNITNERKKKLFRELIDNTINMEPLSSLLAKTKTFDQARALLTFTETISNKNFNSTVILTSARGRGKSAVIGLSAAAAISYGLSNIVVTAANPENLNCFFAFLFIGLKILNYIEGKDFEVIQNSKLKNIDTVIVNVTHHQTIKFVPFAEIEEKKSQIELLIIDEAALIPYKELEKLDGAFLIFMSSTTSGYEGTGKEFTLKLVENLKRKYFVENHNFISCKKRVLKEMMLEEPIRYSSGDPVESWLNSFLYLDTINSPNLISGCPDPRICQLFLVDRNSLFSFHKIAKQFLQRIMTVFSSSHYRNSPDDLQLLADAPSHRILVLTSPLTFVANFLPDILSAIHFSYEGQISRVYMESNLINEKFSTGDLLPWIISTHFQDSSFGELSGIRIIRITTQPDVQDMGYGTRAIELLKKFCIDKKKNLSLKSNNLNEDQKILCALLIDLQERYQPSIDYIGVSFSISPKLLCFWLKNGFSLILVKSKREIYWKQTVCVMIRLFSKSNKESFYWTDFFQREFLKEFLSLCSMDFKYLSTNIIFNIIESCKIKTTKRVLKKYYSSLDLKRLLIFSKMSIVSFKIITYLIPIISKSCLWEFLEKKILNLSELLVLISLGLQLKNFNDIKIEFGLKKHNLTKILKGMFNKFIKFL